MLIARAFDRLRRKVAGAATAIDGVAAVEFSLILPLMLVLYFGSIAVTQAVRASRKVDLVASALANLASQQLTCLSLSTPCLTDTDMTGSNGVFTAAAAILAPYDVTNLKMTVSQVTISTFSGSLVANVNWTATNGSGATARPCNGGGANKSLLAGTKSTAVSNFSYYLPASYTATGAPTGSMIVADVTYQYKPGYGWDFFKWGNTSTAFSMGSIGYYRNRNSSGGAAGPITPLMVTSTTICT